MCVFERGEGKGSFSSGSKSKSLSKGFEGVRDDGRKEEMDERAGVTRREASTEGRRGKSKDGKAAEVRGDDEKRAGARGELSKVGNETQTAPIFAKPQLSAGVPDEASRTKAAETPGETRKAIKGSEAGLHPNVKQADYSGNAGRESKNVET